MSRHKEFIVLLVSFVAFFVLASAAVYGLFAPPAQFGAFPDREALREAQECLSRRLRMATLSSPGGDIAVAVADTQEAGRCGLSFRTSIPDDHGMVFFFDRPIMPEGITGGIWMKDMRFSLDLVWLDSRDGRIFTVVGIERNVSPETFPRVFYPHSSAASHVLEINAGASERFGIVEDSVLIAR